MAKNGFTMIPNGLLEKMYKSNISQKQHQVIEVLHRKIHGWVDSLPFLTIYQVQKEIGGNVQRIKQNCVELEEKGFISIEKIKRKKVLVYRLYTIQSVYCTDRKCTLCNPYSTDRKCTRRNLYTIDGQQTLDALSSTQPEINSLNKSNKETLSKAASEKNNFSYPQILEIVENTQLSPFPEQKYYEALCDEYKEEPDYYVGKTIMLVLHKWFTNKSKISIPFKYLENALEHHWLSEPDNQVHQTYIEKWTQTLLKEEQDDEFEEEEIDSNPDDEDFSTWTKQEIFGKFYPYRRFFPENIDHPEKVDEYFVNVILNEVTKHFPGYTFNPAAPNLKALFREYERIKKGGSS